MTDQGPETAVRAARSPDDRKAGLNCRILIVDDELANVRLLERVLQREGYTALRSTTDARSVISLYREFQPDLLLLDLLMPHLDGYAVLQMLAAEVEGGPFFPSLVLTADITPEAKNRALSLGATDFLTKPFDRVELLLRIRNALHTRLLSLGQRNQNQVLEQRVRERTEELELARFEVIERLAYVSEFRDDDTHRHTLRVGELSGALARTLGLPAGAVEMIRRVAPLHDIGKVGIPDAILLKPMKLTEEEFEQMKLHTVIGGQILAGGRSELIRTAELLALTHHEHWDGRGYPHGLVGAAIPLISRIVSVADVFDALTHVRPYKTAWPVERALAEIDAQKGRALDPEIVEALSHVLENREPGVRSGPTSMHRPAGDRRSRVGVSAILRL